MRRHHLSTILVLVLLSTSSWGQSVTSPMRGLRFLSETVADSDDAIGVEINPAGIGFLNGWSFMFYHSQFGDLSGEGDGAFFAAKIFGPWSVGLGLQFLKQTPVAGTAQCRGGGGTVVLIDQCDAPVQAGNKIGEHTRL